MPDDALTLPALRLYPDTVLGIPVPLVERRFTTYRQAFLGELLQWFAETKLSRADVADQVEAIVSVIQQLHQLHQIDRCKQEDILLSERGAGHSARSIGQIVDEVVAGLGNGGAETRQ